MDDPFAGCTVEGGLEIVWALDRQGVQRDSRRPCGGLRGTKLDFADSGIPKHRQMGKRRHGFFEGLDLFAAELRKIEEQSRKVAARTAKTLGPPARHGIAFQVYSDDRGRARRPHCSLEGISRGGDDDIAFEIDQLVGEVGKPVERRFIDPGFNQRVLTVDVPGVAQPLDERRDIFIPGSLEKADPGDLATQLLRTPGERPKH